jgi:hypothetical protein
MRPKIGSILILSHGAECFNLNFMHSKFVTKANFIHETKSMYISLSAMFARTPRKGGLRVKPLRAAFCHTTKI